MYQGLPFLIMEYKDIIRSEEPIINTMDLEDMVLMLCSVGRPNVYCSKSGDFKVSVEMFVSAKGASFDIGSEFGHKTPKSAAMECIERVRIALKDIKQLA